MRTPAVLLRAVLRVLKQLVVAKPTLPVLGYIRIEAAAGQLIVDGTDLDTCVCFTMPAVEDLAPVLLPFKRFATLLDAAGGKRGEVSIEVQGRRVVVGAAGRSFQFDSPVPVEEYPAPIPKPKSTKSATFANPEDLAAALDWLLPAVSADPTRPMLTGLCFDGPILVACDGHRLHQVTGLPALEGGKLLPAPAARTLLAFLKAFKPESLSGIQAEGTFGFQVGMPEVAFSMTSKSIEAEPPDFSEVIPKSDSTAAEVSVEQLDAALALAARVAGSGYAKLLLNGALVVEASDLEDGGCIREEVEAQRVHGSADVQVGMNLGFLRDALMTKHPTAIIGMTDEMSPVTVRFPDDEGRLAVVMPTRL